MQNYHMRQMNSNINNINPNSNISEKNSNNNINNNNVKTSELSDEEFLQYYKEKYPEEYQKLIKEANNEYYEENQINSINESPYENSNDNIDEKISDMERILNNEEINESSPLELFLCLTKLYNDFYAFFKRQGIHNLEKAIQFKNYAIKNKELSHKLHLNNFNKEKDFLELNFRNIRDDIFKLDKYQQITYLLSKQVKFDGGDVVLDTQMILKSFINGTSTPNFCKMNKFQTQNLKPSSLYSANLQKFKITKLFGNKIDGFISLKNLYLDGNKIQEIKGLNFPNLEELNLSDNYIRKIENLEFCPKLKILNLSYNNIYKLENIEKNIFLENINISNQYIPNFIKFIIKSNSIPMQNHLKILNLENINLWSLPPLQNFQFLQEFNIKNNQISEFMQILSVVKNSPYIRKINCLGNPFITTNKSNYRNFIIIAGKYLEEVDEKEVKENEKIYINQLYNRKYGQKKAKTKEKNQIDIGRENLIITKVSKPVNPKYNNNLHPKSPYDYYNYQ